PSVHDTATLQGATPDAGGTVDYRYYTSQSDCAADGAGTGGIDVGTVNVTDGVVPNSATVTFNTAGTFYWAAFYSGDNNNVGNKSNCADEVLTVINPSISIVKTANPISGAPGDTVTYTYVVKNTGDTTLFNVVVTDDKLGPINADHPIPSLTPGQSVTLTKTTTLPSTAGALTNVGTATGTDVLGTKVSAHDNATVTVVLAILVKTGTNDSGLGIVGFLFIALGVAMATRKERGRVRPAFASSSGVAGRA